MSTVRCTVCNNEALRAFVDTGLDKGLSARGIAASLEAAGGKMDPDVISRHRANHYTPPPPPEGAPKPTKRDLAIMLRDKVADAVERAEPRKRLVKEDGEWVEKDVPFDVLDPDLSGALSMGLKAQAIVDKREAEAKKLGLAAGALGFQMYLAGLGRDDAPALPDGSVEGTFKDVTPS